MIIGYARVSTLDKAPQRQRDALEEAGCEQVFEERVTGTKRERPELLRIPANVTGHSDDRDRSAHSSLAGSGFVS